KVGFGYSVRESKREFCRPARRQRTRSPRRTRPRYLACARATLPRVYVPETQRSIAAGRSQDLAVGRKSSELYQFRMAFQPAFFVHRNIPQPNHIVTCPPRGNEPAVWRKDHVEAKLILWYFE